MSKIGADGSTYCDSSTGVKSKVIDSFGSSNAPVLGGTLKGMNITVESIYGSVQKTREDLGPRGGICSMQNEIFGNGVISEEET